jgi:hypothetical protein
LSDFFDPPPPPPEVQDYVQPEWMGPRENEVGVAGPLQLLLARTDEVAVTVQGGAAYSNGFEFRLVVRKRKFDPEFIDPFGFGPRRSAGEELLRFGVQLADGRKATLHSRRPPDDADAAQPRLMQRGSSGGGRTWDMGLWLWPLPPRGPLAFVCEWPSEGIPLTRAEIDANDIVEAAARVETLWPEGGAPSSHGWSSSLGVALARPESDD